MDQEITKLRYKYATRKELKMLLFRVLTLELVEQCGRGIGPHNIILLPLQISKPVLSSSQFCGSNYCALQKIINASEMTAKK